MISLFRSKIFLRQFMSFFFIIFFTFVTISVIFFTTTKGSLEHQQLDEVEHYRTEASSQLIRWLEGRTNSIKTNARYIAQFSPEFIASPEMRQLLQDQINYDENLVDLLILNDRGEIINSITGPMSSNLSNRQYFMDGKNGKSSVSGLYISAKGSLILAIGEPVFQNGKPTFIAVGIISVNRVREVVESLQFGDIGHAYLVSPQGTFVTASRIIDHYREDHNLSEGEAYQIRSLALSEVQMRHKGTRKYTDFQGQKVFGSYEWLEPLQIGLIVEFNHAKVMKPIYDLIRVVGALAVIVLFTGILSSYLLSRRIIDPIKLLIDATTSITEKKYQNPLTITTRSELDQLVSHFNEMQLAIQEREHLLEWANEELREQRAEALHANQLKGQFLANMSHELRTPLNSIIGFTNRVIKKTGEILPQTQLENLKIVKEEAEHLLELINSLLDYSKIEAGKMEVHIDSFNLLQLVREVDAIIATLIEEKSIRYEQAFFDPESIPIKSDRMKVKQILINLLSNAFKYSEHGTVKLTILEDGANYLIHVEDEGIGIAAEHLESIFDEFRQVDGSYTRKVGGTGLGLSITKRFTELLGGRIDVESTPGKGTHFMITLPSSIREKEQPDEVVEPSSQALKKVVCIDDDPNVQRLYKQYLQEHGFEVICLQGWEDVCQTVREVSPDVILLDIMLPVKDGWQILSELKDSPETRKIPVIMVSVLSEKNLAYKMRADEFLIKPVTQDEVLEAIESTCAKREGLEILLADDDENYLKLFSQFINEHGVAYRVARNGEEVLRQIKKRKPDLLVLDIMMPQKDGFTIIDEINALPECADLPIIVVTAKDLTNQERLRLHDRTKMVIQKSGCHIESVMQLLIQKIKELQEDAPNSPS